jgi:glucose/arabinose dehydrogenase
LAIYRGAAFPRWQENLFVGALVDQKVRRITLEAGRVASEAPIFA